MPVAKMLRLAVSVCLLSHAAAVQPSDVSTPATGRPANLCQELVAFVRHPAAGTQATDTSARLATAVSAKNSVDASAKSAADRTLQNS